MLVKRYDEIWLFASKFSVLLHNIFIFSVFFLFFSVYRRNTAWATGCWGIVKGPSIPPFEASKIGKYTSRLFKALSNCFV